MRRRFDFYELWKSEENPTVWAQHNSLLNQAYFSIGAKVK